MGKSTQARGRMVTAVLEDRSTGIAVLETAADQAARTGAFLTLVPAPRTGTQPSERPTGTWLAQRVDDVRRQRPGMSVTVTSGQAPSQPSTLLVGTRSTFAPAPDWDGEAALLITPPYHQQARRRLVVALVQHHPSDAAVVRAAAEEARARGCALSIVHGCLPRPGEPESAAMARAHANVTHVLGAARALYGIEISAACGHGAAAQMLVHHGAGAELLVLNGSADLDDATVAEVLRHATSDVMVIRRPEPPSTAAVVPLHRRAPANLNA